MASQMFRRVAIPLIKPAVIFVAVRQFIVTWNEFFLAMIVMTDNNHKRAPVGTFFEAWH